MFSKISRYRKSDDVVVEDRSGRLTASKALRRIPGTGGQFVHTVEENDRLDHLAYKYYGQPGKWWRIADANPEFPFPPAALGKNTVATEHFPLAIDSEGEEPVWGEVLASLDALVGVEHSRVIKEEVALVERAETLGSETVTVLVGRYRYTVVVRYNERNLESGEVATRLTSFGLTVGPHERTGRIGKTLVIPPDTVA